MSKIGATEWWSAQRPIRGRIMNYCNPNWNGNGTLSELDRLGVSLLYGRSGNPPIAGNAPSMVEYVTGSNRQFESLFVTSTGALGLTWKLNNSAWKGPVNLSEPNFLPQGGIISTIAYPLGNQLEAFYAANDGAIYVSFKANNGAWSEPQQLTDPGTTRAGAYLASAFYPTNNQLEVMFFDAQGRLNVLWKAQNGRWNGPVAISGPIAPAGGGIGVKHYPVNNQLEAMFIANNGAVHIAWKANNGAWQGPVGISAPGLAPAGSGLALSYHPLGKQLEGHFVDNRGVVNVIWKVNNGNWYPPMGITPAGFGVPGRPIVTSNYSLNQQLEGATVGPDGRINLFWKARNGPWKTVGLTGPNAASPGAPLDIEFSTPNNQLEIMFADPAGNMTLLFKAQNRAWSQAIRF